MREITSEKKPIKLWLDYLEDGAEQQAKNLANLPFAFSHVAIMPDSHSGYGMPIGGVLATEGFVVSNAVGVDIGCGMCAVRTSLKDIERDKLKEIMGKIREAVPVGFSHHKGKQDVSLMPKREGEYRIVNDEFESALHQLGTLGGGNHFIEIQQGSDGRVWVMIHSGSRNFGKKTADYYNGLAKDLNYERRLGVPPSWDLAPLPLDSAEGKAYLREMQYCVDFALANRKLMMDRILAIINEATQASFDPMINIAHNYAALENHFGKDVLVHRKGATLAAEGTVGIIPGSQGSKSYIVKGKGNRDSFNSCSHGAGRKMSRSKARENLSLEDEKNRLDELGVIHAIRSESDLDEAPGAYKPIDEVMRNQADLVEIVTELSPLAVIKG